MTFEFFEALDTGRARTNNEDSVTLDEAVALAVLASRLDRSVLFVLGLLTVVLGASLAARDELTRRGASGAVANRLPLSIAGAVLLLYWLLPSDHPLAPPRPASQRLDLFFAAVRS